MKKILFVTSTRAEYGLLKPFILKLKKDDAFSVTLAVTGTHLINYYGHTIDEIINDGLIVDFTIPIMEENNIDISSTHIMATAMEKFSNLFTKITPDFVLVLGDRFEILAITIAAYNNQIPVIHLYGGETTQGAFDEGYRHAITKLSYLHFTSTDQHRNRVIQLGESPDRVFNIGAIGIENVLASSTLSLDELERILKIKVLNPYILVTYHPETLSKIGPVEQIETLINACKKIEGFNFIFTKSNADSGGNEINKYIESIVEKNSRFYIFDSLGQMVYLSLLKHSRLVLGNSSSGLIEAPSFLIPTINVGDRQKGRPLAKSVINSKLDTKEIVKNILLCTDINYRKKINNVINPFGNGETSTLFIKILRKIIKQNNIILKKEFYDIST